MSQENRMDVTSLLEQHLGRVQAPGGLWNLAGYGRVPARRGHNGFLWAAAVMLLVTVGAVSGHTYARLSYTGLSYRGQLAMQRAPMGVASTHSAPFSIQAGLKMGVQAACQICHSSHEI